MIELIKVSGHQEGNVRAHDILKLHLHKNSLLVMCGGIYTNYTTMIVEPNDLRIKAACIGDERFGEQFHLHSNELMLKNQGVINYFEKSGVEFYKVLHGDTIENTARNYNLIFSSLFLRFPERVGVVGIGVDDHTAGIFPHSIALHAKDNVIYEHVANEFGERITMTMNALSQFTTFVILSFGEKKAEAIRRVLNDAENDINSFPAIFYRKTSIKSYLITDQAI
ncbi:6-phosphogluconolactonase [Candidatus Curtissbacteria bacterium]|nr:6-phosphogluconolactonase [Candidatus Curtissbacteria bacterium]